MGRIRTVKPELFTSEGLYELEIETGFPIRIAFVGMFGQADREGRFKWRPRMLKSQVLPYDDIDFSEVLEALEAHGYIKSYVVMDEKYGVIPKFLQHQFVNNKETKSCLPSPELANDKDTLTRGSHVAHTLSSRGVKEGKGKERNITTNTNPVSKALLSKKEKDKNQNRVNKDIENISHNSKSYKDKMKTVKAYLESLPREEVQGFYNSAIHQRPYGTTTPERGSKDEGVLLIEWYKTLVLPGEKRL